MKTYNIGIIGCGDFLRWQEGGIADSENICVKLLFDPDVQKMAKYAEKFEAKSAGSAEEIFENPEIDIVCIFVPPWLRKEMVRKAVDNGKHIISTKPLAPTIEEAQEILEIVGDKVRCGLIYNRTGNAVIETAMNIFKSGEIGKMGLYKQDWIHHYPAWNNWALDPEKNGGPFMDAMIHNLNIAKYLAGGQVEKATLFTDNFAHPELKCSDTDFMKIDFCGNSSAYLFITWAADLAVYSTAGNDREHIDITYMVTSEGWRLTQENRDGVNVFVASKDGAEKIFPIALNKAPTYQRFAQALEDGSDMPADFVGIEEASEDIRLIRESASVGKCANMI